MKLKIYFPADWHNADSPCHWALCDEADAVTQAGTGTLVTLPKSVAPVAIIPASRLSCVTVPMPPQARKRWESALPYVAEEYTITDPAENHVVPGAIQKDGKRALFIVDKQWLQDIVAACHKVGIALRHAIPEILLVDLPSSGWSMVWDGHHGFIRTGLFSGMALDRGNSETPPQSLVLSLNAAHPALPAHIQLHPVANSDRSHHGVPSWNGLPVALEPGKAWDWRTAPIPDNLLNLLWGALAPKARVGEWLQKLRPLALLLLAVLAIETIGANLQWALLSHEKRDITQTMEHTFRQAFGSDITVVNPALQMQRKIAEMRHNAGVPDESDFLPLLDQAAGPLSVLPTGSITAMHYEPGTLIIDVNPENVADLKALLQKFKDAGLDARSSETHNPTGAAEIRLTIQPGGRS